MRPFSVGDHVQFRQGQIGPYRRFASEHTTYEVTDITQPNSPEGFIWFIANDGKLHMAYIKRFEPARNDPITFRSAWNTTETKKR